MGKKHNPTREVIVVAPSEKYLTVAEIAARYRKSVGAVHHWIVNGISYGGTIQRLAAFKAGGGWRIAEADLDDFLRRINPENWRQAALAQDKERREAKRDRRRLARSLGERYW